MWGGSGVDEYGGGGAVARSMRLERDVRIRYGEGVKVDFRFVFV